MVSLTVISLSFLVPETSESQDSSNISYSYDSLGRLVRVEYLDGRVYAYEYDAAGNRRTVVQENDNLPLIYLLGASTTEGSQLIFNVVRLRSTTNNLRIYYETLIDGDATPGQDYELSDCDVGNLSQCNFVDLDANVSSAEIRINTIDDEIDEPVESMRLRLVGVEGNLATIDAARQERDGYITDNDRAGVFFSVLPASANEGEDLVFSVMRDGDSIDPNDADTVIVETVPGSAKASADFVEFRKELRFEGNQTKQEVRIQTIDNKTYEGPETMRLRIVDVSEDASVLIGQDEAEGAIYDGADLPELKAYGVATIEKDSGENSTASIGVWHTKSSVLPITVQYRIIYLPGQADVTDFDPTTPMTGLITFPPDVDENGDEIIYAPGQGANDIVGFTIAGDDIVEGDETFQVQLFDPRNAKLGTRALPSVTIRDNDSDDVTAMFNINNTETVEYVPGLLDAQGAVIPLGPDNGQVQFGIKRWGDLTQTQTLKFSYSEVGGQANPGGAIRAAATPGVDFDVNQINTTKLVFCGSSDSACANNTDTATIQYSAAGATSMMLSVDTIADAVSEGTEVFYVDMSFDSGSTGHISKYQAFGAIIDSIGTEPAIANVAAPEASGKLEFELTFANPSVSDTEVIVFTTREGCDAVGVTCAGLEDYVPKAQTLVMPAGQTGGVYFIVDVVDDVESEQDEVIFVSYNDNIAIGTILNDAGEDSSGKISAKKLTNVGENVGFTTVELSVEGASVDKEHVVSVQTQSGSAAEGEDFVKVSTDVVFAPGETKKQVAVPILDDQINEADEDLGVKIEAMTDGDIVDGGGDMIIIDNDPGAEFSVENVSVIEGGVAVVTVRKSGETDRTSRVTYKTKDATAFAGSDYLPISGRLTFGPQDTYQTLTIYTNVDEEFDPDEYFELELSAPTGGAVVTLATAHVTITNQGAFPRIVISDEQGSEGAELVFTVSLTEASAVEHSVTVTTSEQTAAQGPDFIAGLETLIFAPGETSKTFSVQTIADNVTDGAYSENFKAELSDPTGGAVLGDSYGLGTIFDSFDYSGNYCSGVVWDQATAGTGWTVAAGGLDADFIKVDYYQPLFANKAVSTGKWYWEVTSQQGPSVYNVIAGISPTNAMVAGTAAFGWVENVIWGRRQINRIYVGDGTSATNLVTPWPAPAGSYVYGYALDLDSNTLTITVDGADGFSVSLDPNVAEWYPLFYSFVVSSASVTANFGATAFAGTMPVGFSAYDEACVSPPSDIPSYTELKDTAVLRGGDSNLETFFIKKGTTLTVDMAGGAGGAANDTVVPAKGGAGVFEVVTARDFFLRARAAKKGLGPATYSEPNADETGGQGSGYSSIRKSGHGGGATAVSVSADRGSWITLAIVGGGGGGGRDYIGGDGGGLGLSGVDGPGTKGGLGGSLTTPGIGGIAQAGDGGAPGQDGTTGTSVYGQGVGAPGKGDADFGIGGGGSASPNEGGGGGGGYYGGGGGNGGGSGKAGGGGGSGYLSLSAEVQAIMGALPTLVAATSGANDGDGYVVLTAQLPATPAAEPANKLRVNNANASEGGSLAFTLQAVGPITENIDLSYALEAGTATLGSDLEAVVGTLSFAPGDTVKSIIIDTLEDTLDEPDEDFRLVLTVTAGDAAIVGTSYAVGTIANDDTPPGFSILEAGYTVEEGAEFLFSVRKDMAGENSHTIEYETEAVTAKGFEPVSGTLTFAPNEMIKTVKIDTVDDNMFDDGGDFAFRIKNPSPNGVLQIAEVINTVTDNDTGPSISIASMSIDEGEDAKIRVSLTSALPESATVHYKLDDGTAKAGVHYDGIIDPLEGDITFAPGEQEKFITVRVLNNGVATDDLTFSATLSAVPVEITAGLLVAEITIVDDEDFAAQALDVTDGLITLGPDANIYSVYKIPAGKRVVLSMAAGAGGSNPDKTKAVGGQGGKAVMDFTPTRDVFVRFRVGRKGSDKVFSDAPLADINGGGPSTEGRVVRAVRTGGGQQGGGATAVAISSDGITWVPAAVLGAGGGAGNNSAGGSGGALLVAGGDGTKTNRNGSGSKGGLVDGVGTGGFKSGDTNVGSAGDGGAPGGDGTVGSVQPLGKPGQGNIVFGIGGGGAAGSSSQSSSLKKDSAGGGGGGRYGGGGGYALASGAGGSGYYDRSAFIEIAGTAPTIVAVASGTNDSDGYVRIGAGDVAAADLSTADSFDSSVGAGPFDNNVQFDDTGLTHLQLLNDNLTAFYERTPQEPVVTEGTWTINADAQSTGKYYWEAKVNSLPWGGCLKLPGSSSGVTSVNSDAITILAPVGHDLTQNYRPLLSCQVKIVDGDTLSFAADLDASKVAIAVNGNWLKRNRGGVSTDAIIELEAGLSYKPAHRVVSRTEPYSILGGALKHPANTQMTFNFGATPFRYLPPLDHILWGDYLPSPGDISVYLNDAIAMEGTPVDLEVTLEGTVTQATIIDYTLAAASAIVGQDYTGTSGTITLNPGDTGAMISVPTIDDALTEGRETFTVSLSSSASNVVFRDGLATGFIADDESTAPIGEVIFDTPGTHNWTAPAGVTSVHAVLVGGGGGANGGDTRDAGAGGALAWKNAITVVPGQTYTLVVGQGGGSGQSGGDSSFEGVAAGGGSVGIGSGSANDLNAVGGTFSGADGGGEGGWGRRHNGANKGGGGGAGGYTGNGGAGFAIGSASEAGMGGGGSGGSSRGGGGVGLFGQGANGPSVASDLPGEGGSGGADGSSYSGGGYGGGAVSTGTGGGGAVRIIWGDGRGFPENADIQTDPILTTGPNIGAPANITVAAVSAAEGENLVLTFDASVAVATDVELRVSTIDSSAVAGEDYTSYDGAVSLSQGASQQTLTIPTFDNSIADGDKTFVVVLDYVSGNAILSNTTAIATIVDDEPAYITESFTTNTTWVAPAGVTELVFVTGKGQDVIPSQVVDAHRNVVYFNKNNTFGTSVAQAFAQTEFNKLAGLSSSVFAVQTNSVRSYKADGTIVTNSTGGSSLVRKANGGPIKVGAGWTASVSEGVPAPSSYTFRIEGIQTQTPEQTGGASTAFGYTFAGGDVGVPAVAATHNLVPVIGGQSYDIVVPEGGQVDIAYWVIGEIASYDSGASLSIDVADVVVDEGEDLIFTFTSPGTNVFPIRVNYATADTSATDGNDYTGISGSINLYPGETQKSITVATISDSVSETDETFRLDQSISGGNATLSNSPALGTINDAPFAPVGEVVFSNPGTYTWTVPADVTLVHVVAVGGGGGTRSTSSSHQDGGGGGALAWKNGISVVPGQSYTIVVGAGGAAGTAGSDSSFLGLIAGGGAAGSNGAGSGDGGNVTALGGTFSGADGGGNGGGGIRHNGSNRGGAGGAGGYSGAGGDGAVAGVASVAGVGGSASGGSGAYGGGGVGVFGESASGASVTNAGGAGGSGGANAATNSAANGGVYGGGGSGYNSGKGGDGAVRIIWGTGRSFPTNAGATQ